MDWFDLQPLEAGPLADFENLQSISRVTNSPQEITLEKPRTLWGFTIQQWVERYQALAAENAKLKQKLEKSKTKNKTIKQKKCPNCHIAHMPSSLDLDPSNKPYSLQFQDLELLAYRKRVNNFTIQIEPPVPSNVCAYMCISIHSDEMVGLNQSEFVPTLFDKKIMVKESNKLYVFNLRYGKVSSVNGGAFRLRATMVDAFDNVLGICMSDPIVVKSERLHMNPKRPSLDHVVASDPIVCVPGIGKKYSDRFIALGVHTVADFVSISKEDLDEFAQNINCTFRGTLNYKRLVELRKELREVLNRS